MAPIVTRIDAAGNTRLGEGPHWDPKTQSLYFVDIDGGTIHKYCPAANTATKATIEGKVGSNVSLITPINGRPNKFAVAVDRELGIATWDGQASTAQFERVVEVDTAADAIANRINDGKSDAAGRMWFGTIGVLDMQTRTFANNASFYSLRDGKANHHFGDVSVSNGLAWNRDNTKLYYIDSPTKHIVEFDFDLATGDISNRKVLCDFPQLGINGVPDGMTIDTDDNLWVAAFDGSCVAQISTKDGTLLQKLQLPALQITSAAWGGENLDELYVTSARTLDPSLAAPVHGGLYKVTNLGFKGLAMHEVVL